MTMLTVTIHAAKCLLCVRHKLVPPGQEAEEPIKAAHLQNRCSPCSHTQQGCVQEAWGHWVESGLRITAFPAFHVWGVAMRSGSGWGWGAIATAYDVGMKWDLLQCLSTWGWGAQALVWDTPGQSNPGYKLLGKYSMRWASVFPSVKQC